MKTACQGERVGLLLMEAPVDGTVLPEACQSIDGSQKLLKDGERVVKFRPQAANVFDKLAEHLFLFSEGEFPL